MLAEILLPERRSLENPSTPLSAAADWLYDAMGATRTASGIRVNQRTALTYAAVWRAVSLISGDTGILPLMTYRRQEEGKERDTRHPAYRLLRYRPNPDMTASVFRENMQHHVLLTGNAYAVIIRDGAARPTELWPLDPACTYPVREDGRLLYVTKIDQGDGQYEYRKLFPEDVLHVKGLGYDGLVGYSVVSMAADSLGLGMGASRYASRFFANDAKPGSVIEVPGSMALNAMQEMRRQWNELHKGVDNAHKAAVLTNGAKVHAISINARDAQLLELRQFELREVANWFGLPPHKVGDTTRTAYASLEQENQSYLDEALNRWLVKWEEECRDKLLTEQEKDDDTHIVEFNRNALIRVNAEARGTFYATALQNGYMNRDEVRAKENMNPLPDGEGKKFFIPLNMQLTGQDVEDEADDADVPSGQPVAEPTEDVQGQALNGAQIDSLVAIIGQVGAGQLTPTAAKLLIAAAFPALTQAQIAAMVDAVEIKPVEEQPPPEPPVADAPDDEPEGDDEPTELEEDDDEEDSDRAERQRAAHREIVLDALRRSARRLGLHARKAAKKPDRFMPWVDTFDAEHGEVVERVLAPVGVLVGCDARDLAGRLFAACREECLELAGRYRPAELVEGVATGMDQWEASAPVALAEGLLTVEVTT